MIPTRKYPYLHIALGRLAALALVSAAIALPPCASAALQSASGRASDTIYASPDDTTAYPSRHRDRNARPEDGRPALGTGDKGSSSFRGKRSDTLVSEYSPMFFDAAPWQYGTCSVVVPRWHGFTGRQDWYYKTDSSCIDCIPLSHM